MKYKILKNWLNGHSFYTMKHKILKTVPKRPPVILQQNTKFWKLYPNCHPLVFLQWNTKFGRLYPNVHPFSYHETQKILKTVPKQSFVFSTRKYETYLFIINLVSFLNKVNRWKFSHWFDWEPKLSYQQATSILKDIYPGVQDLSRRSVRRFCCKTCISSGMSSKKMNELVMDVSSKWTHFFTVAFPVINHWFGLNSGECGEFSITYVFITIFVNNVYSKFNNVSNYVSHSKKNTNK